MLLGNGSIRQTRTCPVVRKRGPKKGPARQKKGKSHLHLGPADYSSYGIGKPVPKLTTRKAPQREGQIAPKKNCAEEGRRLFWKLIGEIEALGSQEAMGKPKKIVELGEKAGYGEKKRSRSSTGRRYAPKS